MVRYAAQNAIENAEQLKNFDLDGYQYHAAASNDHEWVFQRRAQDRV